MILRLLLLATALTGPAQAAERRFTITDFDSVRVEGPFSVDVRTGRGPAARASGSARALDTLEVVVEGRTAVVRRSANETGAELAREAPATVALATFAVTQALLIGDGSVTIDAVKGQNTRLVVDGAGTIAVGAVTSDQLEAIAAGAGLLQLAGKVANGALFVRGQGSVDATGLSVTDARLINQGSGALAVTAVRTARIEASGAGKTTVYGRPACDIVSRGSGPVACRFPQLREAAAEATAAPPPPALPRVRVGVPPQLQRQTSRRARP